MTWIGQSWPIGPENLFCQKNLETPKIMDNFSDRLTLEGAGGQTDDTRSTFRPPLKSLGYNGSNELCGRSVASKLSLQQADGFFYQSDMKIREKWKFFSLRPPGRKRKEISVWVLWVKWCPHIGQKMPCWQSVAAGPFWPCFACPKLGDAGKTRVASKNREVFQKAGRSQFWL